MFKFISVIIWLMLFSSKILAVHTENLTSFKWLSSISNYKYKKSQQNKLKFINDNSSANDEYTDFSGNWFGKCYQEDGSQIVNGINLNWKVKSDANNIEICYEGRCDQFAIGKDLGAHRDIEQGFFDGHYAFKWLNKSSLVFSLIELDVQPIDLVQSTLIRVIFSKEQDKFIIRSEYVYFANDDKSAHEKFICEFFSS